jgi:hypothetical protein
MTKNLSKQIKKRKITLDVKQAMNVFVRYYPIFVIVGIIAGFLYLWLLLFCFSIEVTSYFSLNDYLRLAITPIITVTLLVGTYSILNFFVLPPSKEIKKKWCNKREIIFTAILALLFVIRGIYVGDKFYIILGVATLMIFIPIGLFLKNYVKNGFQIFSLVIVFFVFSIALISLAIIKVDNIKNVHDTRDFIEVYLKQHSNLKITNPIKLITLNSQYCFLYDVYSGKVIIVPVENIDYIVKTRTKVVLQG